MRRPLTLLAATLAATAVAAPAAHSQIRFRDCPGPGTVRCATLPVPLDRSGAVPGQVRLHVERVTAAARRDGALVALAGGPGQAAALFTEDFAQTLGPALRNRDLVVLDQRGTGRSGALSCSLLQRADLLDAADEAAACAEQLGPRRDHYSTAASVDDIEALRAALGRERISLYGVSYGTHVALEYAQRYPNRVDRLVLDSVVDPRVLDPFYPDVFAAVPRVLRELCDRGACRGVTADLAADVTRLAGRLAAQPLRGRVVGRDGRSRRAVSPQVDVLDVLVAGDFDALLRSRFPGAVRAALAGDAAPLLRLAERAHRVESETGPTRVFSNALYAATVCADWRMPWRRATPPDGRRAEAEAALANRPEPSFAPFVRSLALDLDVVRLCSRWPAGPEPAAPSDAPPPDVPVLAIEGEEDLRTPLETGARVAARFPRGEVLSLPGVGHSALGSDFDGCSLRALARFFAGRRARGRCRQDPQGPLPIAPVPPRSLADLRPAGGVRGRTGRTATALVYTLDELLVDLFAELDPETGRARVGGLRSGRATLGPRGLVLRRLSYVPGVEVSGRLLGRGGEIRIGGSAAARGVLRPARGDVLVGRIGGRRVRVEFGIEAGEAQARGALARPGATRRSCPRRPCRSWPRR